MRNACRRNAVRASAQGLALFTVICQFACGPAGVSRSAPNIVLFVVDTLRADSLGCYGNSTVDTPAVDRLAREGVLYRAAYAPSSWTRASLASLLTGLYPESHGVQGRESLLQEGLMSMPEYFSQHGYATAAVIANPNVGSFFGFAQGFDSFDELYQRENAGKVDSAELIAKSDVVVARALEWIERAPEPFLLVVLSIDPHWPYDPPAAYDRYAGGYSGRLDLHGGRTNAVDLSPAERERVRAFYYGEVAFNDHSFGKLIDRLRSRRILDDTVVAFTSDHGEEFWEHGWRWHGHQLYQENIRIPLIVRYPAVFPAGQEVEAPVDLVDLLPTFLELAHIPVPAEIDGESALVEAIAGRKQQSDIAYSTLDLDGVRLKAVVADRWKLVYDGASGRKALYDLEEAAFEGIDRTRDRPEIAKELFGSLDALSEASRSRRRRLFSTGVESTVEQDDLPPDSRRALQELGYLEPESEAP